MMSEQSALRRGSHGREMLLRIQAWAKYCHRRMDGALILENQQYVVHTAKLSASQQQHGVSNPVHD